jgi:signal transduction histidine kinase
VDIRSQSALLAAIVTLALAISMLLRPQRQRALTLYSLMCLALFAFFLGDFLAAVTAAPEGIRSGASRWERASLFFGSLVPASALAFFMEFLAVSPYRARRAQLAALVGGLGGLVVALTPLADAKIPKSVVTVWAYAALLVSFSLLLRRMSASESPIERARLRYLCIGAGLAIATNALDILARYGMPLPPLGAVTTTLFMFFLAQTLQRLRLLDLYELLGKIAALTLMAVILVVIYAVLVYWWVGGRFELFLFNTLVASFVILILFEPLRAKVEEFVVAKLFRERFEMIRALSFLKSRIASVIDVGDLAQLVLDSFNETRRVTHSSIYLLAEDRPGFWLLDHRGLKPTAFLDAAAARGLLATALSGQKAVLRENVERKIAELRVLEQAEGRRGRDETKKLTDLKAALVQMHAGIAVPLMGADRVIGFLNLWDERVPEAYASDEIALVLEIGERIGTVVENSKLFEKMKERDRLAALGEMAAGLAHEIRNPLGAIKGAAQFLTPQTLPGENGELLSVIVEEVNRLNTVVTQFLDYSRPMKQNFAPTDIGDVVSRTLKLLASDEIPAQITLKVEIAEKLPKVPGDAEQIKQVLINLVLNAMQAMPDGGTLTIAAGMPDEVASLRFGGGAEMLELRVRDTGQGISAEGRQHIFVPFYTTKEKGTGLGLAICQRIVKNHGGTIAVASRVQEGTEFVIRLPTIPEPREEPPVQVLSEGTPSPDRTPSPDLAPYPGLAAPGEGRRPEKKVRRDKKRKRAGSS